MMDQLMDKEYNMGENVKFLRGNSTDLPETRDPGSIYIYVKIQER